LSTLSSSVGVAVEHSYRWLLSTLTSSGGVAAVAVGFSNSGYTAAQRSCSTYTFPLLFLPPNAPILLILPTSTLPTFSLLPPPHSPTSLTHTSLSTLSPHLLRWPGTSRPWWTCRTIMACLWATGQEITPGGAPPPPGLVQPTSWPSSTRQSDQWNTHSAGCSQEYRHHVSCWRVRKCRHTHTHTHTYQTCQVSLIGSENFDAVFFPLPSVAVAYSSSLCIHFTWAWPAV